MMYCPAFSICVEYITTTTTTTFIGLWQPEGWISNIDIHTKNREKHEGESVTVYIAH